MSVEQSPEEISAAIEGFLAEHARAVVLQEGRVAFDLQTAKYSLAVVNGRCTLQLWSDAGNLVRRVVSAVPRKEVLRLATLRFGQAKPETLEIVSQPDRRTVTAREATRKRYVPRLERALAREWPRWKADPFQSAMDLEKSFGPAYARGVLHLGQQAWAVVGVNAEESQATVDGVLTIGLLWLQLCRERAGGKRLFQGLRLVVPPGMAIVTLSRLAWLRTDAAKWELYELDERTEELEERDPADTGNLTTKLLHAPDAERARDRVCGGAGTGDGACFRGDAGGGGDAVAICDGVGVAAARAGVCADSADGCGEFLCAGERDFVRHRGERNAAAAGDGADVAGVGGAAV